MAEQPTRPQEAFSLETDWIREYARSYLPSELAFSYPPNALRRVSVTLIDIRNVLRAGTVTYSDKLDGPGAIWLVEGTDTEDRQITVKLHVISERLSVALMDVSVAKTESNDNDAA
jgi:hypothetical protein